ncbi:putative NPN-dependent ornithine cyclodeaminase [Clostridium sp. JNZ X4-2]
MNFKLPDYHLPDFSKEPFLSSPNVITKKVEVEGVAPDNYHATSIYPEYFKINQKWVLASESRMDCVAVLDKSSNLKIKEFRNLEIGEEVILGRSEDSSQGIFVHTNGFKDNPSSENQVFSFRAGRSRESSYSKDYDNLYDLLEYEKRHGYILWVLGPAVVFDADSKKAMSSLIEAGYANCIFAGNALATHDLEGSFFKTALGQNIYTQHSVTNGHYNHIDVINKARRYGSLDNFIKKEDIKDGVVYSCIKNKIPLVLAGSIRDDGPLPSVISDVYKAQDIMRYYCKKATTVICLATQLHTIATGNMTPVYKIEGKKIRPVYIYTVDISEFVVNKLRDRGSLEITSIITNVQDFVVNVANNLANKS